MDRLKLNPRFFLLFLLVLLTFVLSCKRKENNLIFNVKDSYDFIGTVEKDNETYFGFCKKNFQPQVKFFDKEGMFIDSISLKNTKNILDEITDVWAYSADSIAVYSNYNGTIVVIDRKGRPILTKSYYNITDSNGYHYDLLPMYSIYPYITNNRNDVVFSTWMWSGAMNSSPRKLLSDVQNGSLLCKINPFGNRKEYHFGFEYKDIVELKNDNYENAFFAPFYKTFFVNDKLIFITNYSRFVYMLSESLTVMKTIKLLDDSQAILHPIPLSQKGSIQDKADETLRKKDESNYVVNILFDSTIENYVVIVKDGPIKANNPNKFQFKVLIFNSQFEKIKTVKITDENLIPHKSFIYLGSLYVEQEPEKLKTNDSKVFKEIRL